MQDIHGRAILDFVNDEFKGKLWVNNTYGAKEEMPVEVFFREEEDLNPIEQLALANCKGHILDVGAGAGALSLILQEKGKKVTALELSPGCCKVMQSIGIQKGIEGDVYDLHMPMFDTVLLMMNGIGLAGKMERLDDFLEQLLNQLNPGGQILFDSSDVSYLYDGKKTPNHYFGEQQFQFEYQKQKGEWFDWLYVDLQTMKQFCHEKGFQFEVLMEDEPDAYLGRIIKS